MDVIWSEFMMVGENALRLATTVQPPAMLLGRRQQLSIDLVDTVKQIEGKDGPTSQTSTHIDLPDPTERDDLAIVVREALRFRQKRSDALKDLVADPAWDILLEVFSCRLSQRRVDVSSLCIAARVPPTTALRWIKTLENRAMLSRRPDPYDGRRFYVEITDVAYAKMVNLFRLKPSAE